MSNFHDKEFDDPTQLKLRLFRGYIEKWLPVFMTQRNDPQRNIERINVFDFFSGPGCDNDGNPGSPTIVMEEVRRYCRSHSDKKLEDVDIRLFFNDKKKKNTKLLRESLGDIGCPSGCCKIEYASKSFHEVFLDQYQGMQHAKTANLVILDQYGVKEVTKDIFVQIARCQRTDLLFFISSFHIKRFIETDEFRKLFPHIDPQEAKNIDRLKFHRYICDQYQQLVPDLEYYLVPFTIEKVANVYGVIFGTGHLSGLHRFVDVCWEEDKHGGESNCNIDGDITRDGQFALFEEDKKPQRVRDFERDMIQYIKETRPNNKDLYKFCLVKRMKPTQVGKTLKTKQDNGELIVTDLRTAQPARKNSFYLTCDNYYKKPPLVRFKLGEEA